MNLSSEETNDFFGSVDFKGERFKGANLPVSLLENVKAFQELLLDLAEEIWREKNPERERLPKNFRRNLSLSFSHVEDGSAIAVLKRDESISEKLLPDEFSLNYMALAQSRFLEISRAANENRQIEGVPTKSRKPLRALLNNLSPDESIEFSSRTGRDTRHPRVRFSSKTRDRILDSAVDDQEKWVDGIGIVRSILDASEEIEVLSEHGVFRIIVGRQSLRANEFPIASFCEFTVLARLRSNGFVKSILKQQHIALVEQNSEFYRISTRIDEFAGFREGWKDGCGKAISTKALTFAQDIAGFICGLHQDISIFPQIDGSITFEFDKDGIDVEVTCRPDYVKLETFDHEMDTLNEQVFFGLSPKLLASLSDIVEFSK